MNGRTLKTLSICRVNTMNITTSISASCQPWKHMQLKIPDPSTLNYKHALFFQWQFHQEVTLFIQSFDFNSFTLFWDISYWHFLTDWNTLITSCKLIVSLTTQRFALHCETPKVFLFYLISKLLFFFYLINVVQIRGQLKPGCMIV